MHNKVPEAVAEQHHWLQQDDFPPAGRLNAVFQSYRKKTQEKPGTLMSQLPRPQRYGHFDLPATLFWAQCQNHGNYDVNSKNGGSSLNDRTCDCVYSVCLRASTLLSGNCELWTVLGLKLPG